MNRRRVAVWARVATSVGVLLLAGCSRSKPQQQSASEPVHSKASLLFERTHIQPKQQTRIGIRLQTDKNWHVYWQNPGDSGEPPRVQWHVPEGIDIGDLRWPTPQRLSNPAGTDYGYEDDVVLLAPLTVTGEVKQGPVELVGDMRWLVCQDVCIPQRTQLKGRFNVGEGLISEAPDPQLIAAAAERVPKPLPNGLQTRVVAAPDAFQLTLSTDKPITGAEFFPLQPEQIDNAAPQQLTRKGQTAQLTLKKSDHLEHVPERLKGVIVLNKHDAYQMDVPVRNAPAHGGRKR